MDPTPMTAALPVADAATVRAHVRLLLRAHAGLLARTVTLFVLATGCGLTVPALLGGLVTQGSSGLTSRNIDHTVLAIAGLLLAQAVLTRAARLDGARLGEMVLADVREDFIGRVLRLPLSKLENAGAGDLLARSTRDVDALSNAVRMGAPAILVASLSVALTLIALTVVSPLLLLPSVIAVPVVFLSTRWYLRNARAAYIAESASYAQLTQGLVETLSGIRTVEALRRSQARRDRTDRDVVRAYAAERRTLFLRSVWYPLMDISYVLPVASTALFGGLFYIHGVVTLGQVTAAVLYARAIIDPLDELVSWLDELQVGDASLARIIGSEGQVVAERDSGRRPQGEQLVADGVSYGYRAGQAVVKDVSLRTEVGERLALIGPSGAGKSTLGRLLSGIEEPDTGVVTLGGVPLGELPLMVRRRHVMLVTQEHHIFNGTVRDNVTLAEPSASDAEVLRALAVVGASDWVGKLPEGLQTRVGAAAASLSPGQAQQVALARLIIANPHTLILDEATSSLNAGAARQLERSMSALFHGRTVIAIAHRLHTARDADRVIVMDDGRITEEGSHQQLVGASGMYASLWHSMDAVSRPLTSPRAADAT